MTFARSKSWYWARFHWPSRHAVPWAGTGMAQTVRLTPQPDPPPAVAPYVVDPGTGSRDSHGAELIRRLGQRVKYVFVIFNENHSFDNEFGTFPGANGLFFRIGHLSAARRRPYARFSRRPIRTRAATHRSRSRRFVCGPEQNAAASGRQRRSQPCRPGQKNPRGRRSKPMMDGFAADMNMAEDFASRGGPADRMMGTQFARLVMSYIDCDTIPFLWNAMPASSRCSTTSSPPRTRRRRRTRSR